jgi:hypothetical protein
MSDRSRRGIRVEADAQPDLASFTLLCAWLGVSPGQFFAPVVQRQVAPIDEAQRFDDRGRTWRGLVQDFHRATGPTT